MISKIAKNEEKVLVTTIFLCCVILALIVVFYMLYYIICKGEIHCSYVHAYYPVDLLNENLFGTLLLGR